MRTKTIRLKIIEESSLFSVLADTEITPSQTSSVIAILKAKNLTYGEVLRFLAERVPVDYEAPAGAGDSVEAFRG